MVESPFERLPPELRNRIYDFVIEDNGPVLLVIRNVTGVRRARPYFPVGAPGLLRTCKSIYLEFQPVYYGRHVFKLLALPNTAPQALQDFIQNTSTPRKLRHLRRLEVCIRSFHVDMRKDTVEDLKELLTAIQRQSAALPTCEIVVVLSSSCSYYTMSPLELNPRTQDSMDGSVSKCLQQISKDLESFRIGRGIDVTKDRDPRDIWPIEQVLESDVPRFLSMVRDGMVYD